jgi:predicted SAM-dependent methyltransferase
MEILKTAKKLFKLSKEVYKDSFIQIFKNIKYHRFGKCNVCGNFTIFFCQHGPDAAREYMHCPFCMSCSRKRHIASFVLKYTSPHTKYGSIKKMAKRTSLDIYNTDRNIWGNFFRNNNHYISSIFTEEYPIGTEIEKNVFCQNLEALTFNDGSFDIVITEDVFEHIRDDKKAFCEIYRVLKKGGIHIFTIPFLFNQETIVRVDTSTGNDINMLPPEYHFDMIRGKIIVYRTFGIDLFKKLSDIGFSTTVNNCTFKDSQYRIYNSSVFVSKKL